MSTSRLAPIVRQLIEMAVVSSDRELVCRFRDRSDGSAFEAIVRRHASMVHRVCYRVLGDSHEAEDAVQATFLLLARNAGSLRRVDSLASWLHGIAYRVSLKARSRLLARRGRERAVARTEAVGPDDPFWSEVSRVLDEELTRLPERLQQPLVLCYLQGKTQDEAAQLLAWSKTTLRRRLEEAKQALGDRLRGRGVIGAAALPGLLVSDAIGAGAISSRVVSQSVEQAVGTLAGTAVVPPGILELTQGVVPMFKSVQLAMSMVFCVAVAGFALALQSPDPNQKGKEAKEVPAKASSITVPSGGTVLIVPQIDVEQKAMAELQGAWILTKQFLNDREVEATFGRLLLIEGDEAKMFSASPIGSKADVGDRFTAGEGFQFTLTKPLQTTWLTINPNKSPAELTLSGNRFLLQTVYKIEGDVLTIAFFSRSEIDRPQGFRVRDTKENGLSLAVWVLRKATEKEKAKEPDPRPKSTAEEQMIEKIKKIYEQDTNLVEPLLQSTTTEALLERMLAAERAQAAQTLEREKALMLQALRAELDKLKQENDELRRRTVPKPEAKPLVVDRTERGFPPEVIPAFVRGLVTLKGKPIVKGKLILHRDGEEKEYLVPLGADGKYKSGRIPAGDYRLTLEGEGVPEKLTRLNTSSLKFTLRGDENVFDIELP